MFGTIEDKGMATVTGKRKKRTKQAACIKGLSASASSRLRKRLRDELVFTASDFIVEYHRFCDVRGYFERKDYWGLVQEYRARYNRARALAAECGV